MKNSISTLAITLVVILYLSTSVFAGQTRTLRLGYLDTPGSAPCLLAYAKGYYKKEGWKVVLTGYSDSRKGLADLSASKIDIGVFALGHTLQQIAADNRIQIIAGSGTAQRSDLLADIDDAARSEQEHHGIVVSALQNSKTLNKDTMIRFVSRLIHAHRDINNNGDDSWKRISKWIKRPDSNISVSFDPNPDFWRLEQYWQKLGLQQEKMPKDYLTKHVYEEIYCEALELIVSKSAPDDQILKKLLSKAVCAPDCCPIDKKKTSNKKEG